MKHARSYLWPGVPLALVSAVLFGASAPFAKLLLGEMSPQLLTGLLYLGQASVWLPCMAAGLPSAFQLRKRPCAATIYPG